VCRQVIEPHLLRTLLEIFCPEKVASLACDDIKCIAAQLLGNVEKGSICETSAARIYDRFFSIGLELFVDVGIILLYESD
jgi:hypothetical protein